MRPVKNSFITFHLLLACNLSLGLMLAVLMLLFTWPDLSSVCAQPLASKVGLRILRSDANGVEFEFTPQNWQETNVTFGDTTFVRFDFLESVSYAPPGYPDLPMKVIPIGIPPGAEVDLQIISTKHEEISGLLPIPVPTIQPTSDVPHELYRIDSLVYTQEEPVPSAFVELESPSWMGELQVVRVKIYPVQFFPAKKILRKYQYFRILVRFKVIPSQLRFRRLTPDVPVEVQSFYQDVVINGSVAKQWLQSPKAKFVKPWRFFKVGEYYKIPISEDGMYKISGRFLKNNGIDISQIDPQTLKIYNNGGYALPQELNAPRPDSLIENAILVFGMEDGRFDADDYLLFYGRSVNNWKYNLKSREFEHYINPYTTTNIYWLVFNDGRPGKRMSKVAVSSITGTPVERFRDHIFREDELYNFNHSGLIWLGSQFAFSSNPEDQEKTFPLPLVDGIQNTSVKVRLRFYGFTSGIHEFRIFLGDRTLPRVIFGGNGFYETTKYTTLLSQSDDYDLTIKYLSTQQNSIAYLDWLEVHYWRSFKLHRDALWFFAPNENDIFHYKISGVSNENFLLFDVTDFANVKLKTGAIFQNNQVSFSDTAWASQPRAYALLTPAAYKVPSVIYKYEIPDLDLRDIANSADFIIITHRDFYNAAMALKNLRETHDRLETMVVDVTDVYDQFSGGLLDPTAIRDFLKYTFFNWRRRPYYVLLFGDGSYDYKNILGYMDENWIPPYETNTISKYSSLTTDDWFACVNGDDLLMEFAIGRIPVRTTVEAENVVKKIVSYATGKQYGPWRNTFTIVADDEITPKSSTETIHTRDAENIAERHVPKIFDLQKVYLMEYPVVYEPAGRRKPRANEDLLKYINQGTLVLNFLGHGNEYLWTHERVLLDTRDFPRIHNQGRLAFWIAATCSFARWDLPNEQSFAEKLLVAENRGAIALCAAARDVSAFGNSKLNRIFLDSLFPLPHQVRRLGDAMRRTKVYTGNTINDRKFLILGDPTLRLAVPQLEARVDSILPDSLKALSKITVKGTILENAEPMSDFNGSIWLQCFDSKKFASHTTPSGSVVNYILPGNPIFRGEAKVTDGQFNINFIVPKDITYGGQLGRVSLYFWNDEIDGSGSKDSLIVDGSSNLVDTQGPTIEVGFDGYQFADGDLLEENPLLIVNISDDKSGINITGEIGHKITLTIDDDLSHKIDLTPYFRYDVNSYLKGKIEYTLTNLLPGEHTGVLKAWDNSNNSATVSFNFRIASSDALTLERVMNYPNPFSNRTSFTFEINQPAEVEVKVYTLSGRLIRRLDSITAEVGFNAIDWDGLDQDGDVIANGVYLYKIFAKSAKFRCEKIGKMIKMK
ncbi:hypothetical protein DRQ11_03035 [candidate division KSB1 bacterium]|nr:MAG: hypothetical protein DRQ11_03035 [candidate division KSB1 bacterium]